MVKAYLSIDSLVIQSNQIEKLSKDDERAMSLLQSQTYFDNLKHTYSYLTMTITNDQMFSVGYVLITNDIVPTLNSD